MKRLLILSGSICLILVLVVLLLPACGPAVPAEVAELQDELVAERAKTAAAEKATAAAEKETAATEKELAAAEKKVAGMVVTPEVFKWKAALQTDVGYFGDMCATLRDEVLRASNGRLDITMYGAGALVPTSEALEACAADVIQASWAAAGYWVGKVPEATFQSGIPGTLRTVSEFRALLEDYGWNEIFSEAYAEAGVKYLPPYLGEYAVLYANRPIRTVADMQGLKLRTWGDMGWVLDRVGASSCYFPLDEVYMALSLGTIDAVCTGQSYYLASKHCELCPYFMSPPFQTITGGAGIASPAAWDSLPDYLKDVLMVCLDKFIYDSNYTMGGSAYTAGRELQLTKEAGYEVEFIEMSDELVAAVEEAGVALMDEKAALSPRCARMVKDMKDVMRVCGYIE